MAESKQIYARVDEDKIAQIAKECDRRGISRPDFVLEAVELHLNDNDWTDVIDARRKAEFSLEASREIRENLEKDIVQLEADLAEANRAHDVQKKRHCDLSDHNDVQEKRNCELADARDANANQRDKFKQKLEEVVQTHEKLISEVREMQSCGVFARASKLKRFNTAKYVIKTEEDKKSEEGSPPEIIVMPDKLNR